jgi:hypothetical protein
MMVEFRILVDSEKDIWTIVDHLAVSELLASNAVGLAAYKPFYDILFDRVYFKINVNSKDDHTITTTTKSTAFEGFRQLIGIDTSKLKEVQLVFIFLRTLEKECRLTDRHILTPDSMLKMQAFVESRKLKRISNSQAYLENLYNNVFF